MKQTYNTEGLILRRWDYKEKDKMLRVFTKDEGKITVRAISARKHGAKLSGHLEPFIHTDLHIARSRTIDIVAGSNTIESNKQLRHSLTHMAIAGFFSEIIDKFTQDNDSDPVLFEHVRDFINWQSQNSPNALAMYGAVLRALVILGYEVDLYNCHSCRREIKQEDTKLNYKLWNVECPTCSSEDEVAPLSVNVIKIFRFISNQPYSDIAQLKLEPGDWVKVDGVMRSLLHYHLDTDLRSEEVYLTILRDAR